MTWERELGTRTDVTRFLVFTVVPVVELVEGEGVAAGGFVSASRSEIINTRLCPSHGRLRTRGRRKSKHA